mmetsp:Transcript_44175/g.86381  ORF Transcript_44175/g.86381 Transcript_44175/m.86381 type:complete len:262 (+) Transcript_44175:455-1240(+)
MGVLHSPHVHLIFCPTLLVLVLGDRGQPMSAGICRFVAESFFLVPRSLDILIIDLESIVIVVVVTEPVSSHVFVLDVLRGAVRICFCLPHVHGSRRHQGTRRPKRQFCDVSFHAETSGPVEVRLLFFGEQESSRRMHKALTHFVALVVVAYVVLKSKRRPIHQSPLSNRVVVLRVGVVHVDVLSFMNVVVQRQQKVRVVEDGIHVNSVSIDRALFSSRIFFLEHDVLEGGVQQVVQVFDFATVNAGETLDHERGFSKVQIG